MFSGIEDDEDLFFAPTSGSNLASLFGTTMVPSPNVNSTLTYTAPKQPIAKTNEPPLPSSPAKVKHQSSVIIFKEIHAFKLVDKQYSPLGKCGFALIGNEKVNLYQLLLYKHKQDIISTSKICSQFQFNIQKNNYVSYYDDQKLNWTIHFNNQEDLNEFSQALQLRGSKIIGNGEKSESSAVHDKTDGARKQDIDNEIIVAKDESIKDYKVDSDNQSDSSNANAKSIILSRMAKMGQKILLPKIGIPKIDSEGSDSDEKVDKTNHKLPRRNKRATTNVQQMPIPPEETSSELTVKNISTNVAIPSPNQQYMLINGQYIPVMQQTLPQPLYLPIAPSLNQTVLSVDSSSSLVYATPTVSSDQLNMFFAENRTHNSELRMNMMKIANKMEEMIEKVSKSDLNATNRQPLDKDSQNDAVLIENERLKTIIAEHEATISNMTIKQNELVKENFELLDREKEHLKVYNQQIQDIEKYKFQELRMSIKIEELQSQLTNQISKVQDDEDGLKKLSKSLIDCILVKKEKFPTTDETIKKLMNLFYNDVSAEFNDNKMFQGNDIKTILAPKIIESTYNILAIVKDLSTNEQN